jgi:hypothetical protein
VTRSDEDRVRGVPNGIVGPPGRLRTEHPMTAWIARERERVRALPDEERWIVLPFSISRRGRPEA